MLSQPDVTVLCLCPTWHAGTFVAGLALLDAGASALARRRAAGQVTALTVLAYVLRRALASVASDRVDAGAAVLAGRRPRVALVDVLFAGLSGEEGCAGTDVVRLDGGAQTVIGTRV